mgnify:CR=1 FL=1|tara:strand:- start:127 stop:780 length:654 start_codon:yes stop_codon:yes gene_type:complete
MKSLKIDNKQYFIHKNDIPSDFDIGKSIAIDTETTGLSLNRDRLCVLQMSGNIDECHLVKFDADLFKKGLSPKNLINLLNNQEIEKIFHFARFDLAMIKKFLNLDCKNVFCTKIASKLVRTYTDKHGLKDLCKELLEIDLNKTQQSSDWSNQELSNNQIKYAASDVLYLNDLKQILIKMLKREDRYDLALDIFNFLETRVKLDLLGWDQNDIFSHGQ